MKAVDYLKARARMTNKCKIRCSKCLFYGDGCDDSCDDVENYRPEEAVAIVEKWAKENPVKTYKDVFLERMPNTKVGEHGDLPGCPHSFFNTKKACPDIINDCVKCWNREYKED